MRADLGSPIFFKASKEGLQTSISYFPRTKANRWIHRVSPQVFVLFEDLSQRNLKTARAYRMKLALHEIYQSFGRTMAEEGLKRLYWWLTHSRFEPMKAMGKAIKGQWDAILNYSDHRRTNGVLEAIKGPIQAVREVF